MNEVLIADSNRLLIVMKVRILVDVDKIILPRNPHCTQLGFKESFNVEVEVDSLDQPLVDEGGAFKPVLIVKSSLQQ